MPNSVEVQEAVAGFETIFSSQQAGGSNGQFVDSWDDCYDCDYNCDGETVDLN